ncbi:hypothetical protein [Kingella potus]|uniref:hypothetical protein n=1 Tax=Kingella potus TaxID=265175 RepID=UPI001FD02A84|nr:hypothetical protein [Kingella potus]UOP01333.1 hypothetical protein LVJ84_03545 [Kingella potus]
MRKKERGRLKSANGISDVPILCFNFVGAALSDGLCFRFPNRHANSRNRVRRRAIHTT